MKYREGVLYNFVFTELPFKMVAGDVTSFHSIPMHDVCTHIEGSRFTAAAIRYQWLPGGLI